MAELDWLSSVDLSGCETFQELIHQSTETFMLRLYIISNYDC